MLSERPLLVVGAGIGGLSLALALLRQGRKVILVEAAGQLGEIGAGITMAPNATRALQFLGLGAALEARADVSTASLAGLHFRSGAPLYPQLVTTSFRERYGADLYLIHRADLQDMLLGAVRRLDPDALRISHRFVGLEQRDDGVIASFADGRRLEAEALVGCDGLRSSVRAALFGADAPRFTGQVAYRGLVRVEDLGVQADARSAAMYLGPGCSFTHYGIRAGTIINFVGLVRTGSWREEGWTTPASVEETLAHFTGWHADVHALIRSTQPGRLAKWALYDREPLPVWSRGRVALLGDAAHPMLPFLGMGAAMSIEDAVVLARCFEASAGVGEAFERYQRARVPRANAVLLGSRRQGEIVQSSDPDRLQALDGQGEIRLGLFDYDPTLVAI